METRFYVATDGNDAWSGRLAEPNRNETDGPLATVARARDAVRELPEKDRGKPVSVFIREGTHFLSEPLRLGPEDSGTADAPVVYAAPPGEKPVLSGGRLITGWKKGTGPLWVADVPEAANGQWEFRQMFVDGCRAVRARSPNEGYLHVDKLVGNEPSQPWKDGLDRFHFKPGDLKAWPNPNRIEAVVYHAWNSSRVRIASVNEEERIVTFTTPTVFRPTAWDRNQRYYIENLFEALDAPGEWYLDTDAGKVYYYPLPGQDMVRAEVIAPALRTLVLLEGRSVETDDPAGGGKKLVEWTARVEHVRFEGLSFQHADWTLPATGHTDEFRARSLTDAAIVARAARDFAIERCHIAHVGAHGVFLGNGCENLRIVQNHFHDFGGSAICAAGAERTLIYNNYIHDGGSIYPGAPGVTLSATKEGTVRHNEICDLDYSGIVMSGGKKVADNVVEDNHIHHVLRGVLSDGAGIYNVGPTPGTIIRRNVIHDVYSHVPPELGFGIYFDPGSKEMTVEQNLCYNTQTGGLAVLYTNDLVIRNNIFSHARMAQVFRPQTGKNITFERNICYVTQGLLFHYGDVYEPIWDNNVYFRTDGTELRFPAGSFERWKSCGVDANSVVADPLFVDPENRDFRLKPESPALKLGFEEFDHGKAGLVGPEWWTSLPKESTATPKP